MFLTQTIDSSQGNTREELIKLVEELQQHFVKRKMVLKHFSCYYDSDNKKHIQISLFESVV